MAYQKTLMKSLPNVQRKEQLKMRKLILVQVLIDFNDWVDQEKTQIKHDP